MLTFLFIPGVPRVFVSCRAGAASPAAVPGGWPPEVGGVRLVAVRAADLRSPLRRPLREGDRTALTAAGGEKIRTGNLVVFCKPVAVARRWCAGTGGCRPAGIRLITRGSGSSSSNSMR